MRFYAFRIHPSGQARPGRIPPFNGMSIQRLTGCWKTRIRPSGKARGDATSAAYSSICEHWREPRNAAWRPQAQFFNSLLLPRLRALAATW